MQEHGIFGDPWVELTPKDSRTGRRKWRGGNYSESHEVKLNENALEQGSLWG